MKKLFEFAIIKQEKRDKDGEIVDQAVVIDSGQLLADDEAQATMLAGREIPEDELEDLERITLAVRPF